MNIVSSSWGRDLICKVGVEVTCQADPRMEESHAMWARHGAICRELGAIFPGQPALLCPAGFASLGTLVDCGSPPTPVFCCKAGSIANVWREAFKLSLKRFFARMRISVSGIFSCHFMLRSFRRLVVWKLFIFWRASGGRYSLHNHTSMY